MTTTAPLLREKSLPPKLKLHEELSGYAKSGTARAVPQEGEATLAPKLSIADGALDLSI